MNCMPRVDLTEHPYIFDYYYKTIGTHWDIFHAHQGMEFLYIHEGEGFVTIGPNIYQFKPDTLIYFQPFQLHRINVKLQKGQSYTRSNITFEPSLFSKHFAPFPSLRQFFNYLWQTKLNRQLLSFSANRKDLLSLLISFEQIKKNSQQEINTEEFALFLLSFLQQIKNNWDTDMENASCPLRCINHTERIMHWIEEHFREKFSLNKLAEELYLSNYHISHLFRKSTGTNITEYLISRRLREACWLLKTTSQPIDQIAMSIGLTNLSYFCQLFKKRTGFTPTQYRQVIHHITK